MCFTVFCINVIDNVNEQEVDFTMTTSMYSLVLWWAIGVPASLFGACLGMRARKDEMMAVTVVKRNKIPRTKTTELPFWLRNSYFLPAICGFLIFWNFHTVLTYMWRSVWRSEAYSLIGYLLCFTILHVIVTAELGIVCTFAGLRHGSYHW